MRNLVTVQTIKGLSPIDGADLIEIATFNESGWQAVVKRDQLKAGSQVFFFEIDSVVPPVEPFLFLGDKRRIRTMKLRGALSQGLAVPVSSFDLSEWSGEDLTEFLGVTKYEPAHNFASNRPESYKHFPEQLGIHKTDEERVQSNPSLLDDIRGKSWVSTVKLDGQSCTLGVQDNGELLVCSRNNHLTEDDGSAFWKVARKYELAIRANPAYIFQGEVCGPNIQGNKLELEEVDFFVFNVFSLTDRRYLNQFESKCLTTYLKTVPIAGGGEVFGFNQAQLLEKAEGFYAGTKNQREGLVFRSQDGLISFKAISNKFLLKNTGE